MKEYETIKIQIKDIKLDGDNPNKFDKGMEERLKRSMDTFGYTQDVIVDKKTMILADGEHRLKEYIRQGQTEIPVKLIPFKNDAQRRAYRQGANKIRGTHEKGLDLEEYDRIIKAGERDILINMTGINISEVEAHLRQSKEELQAKKDAEIKFTQELKEEYNYVVLTFDNEIDWLNALSILDLKTVKALDSKEGYQKMGVGRVLNGPETINKIQGK